MNDEAFITSGLRTLDPDLVYHRVPNWPGIGSPGRKGEELACNATTHLPSGRVVSQGVSLPESVVAPCGVRIYRRLLLPRESRSDIFATPRPGRMVEQGTILHPVYAAKIARPCARCYPTGVDG